MGQAGTQQKGKTTPGSQPPPRSMEDAIARLRAATAAAAQHKAQAGPRRIFHTDLRIPNHPHAKRVQRGALITLIVGMLMIIFLPETFMTHMLAFAAMYALLFIGVPNLLLESKGAISTAKIIGWSVVLLFFGAMTTVAMGPTGNLWSWAPWMQQFNHHAS